MPPLQTPELDVRTRKTVLRMIPYGVFVVTARHGERVGGATIDWVTQASIEPLTIIACLRRDSVIRELVLGAGKFGLHILGESQKDLAAQFFRRKGSSTTEINGQRYQTSEAGVPVLESAPAAVELEVLGRLDSADHTVVQGRVLAVHLKAEARPLLLRDTGWHYGY